MAAPSNWRKLLNAGISLNLTGARFLFGLIKISSIPAERITKAAPSIEPPKFTRFVPPLENWQMLLLPQDFQAFPPAPPNVPFLMDQTIRAVQESRLGQAKWSEGLLLPEGKQPVVPSRNAARNVPKIPTISYIQAYYQYSIKTFMKRYVPHMGVEVNF
jgi:hypothetical protein